MRQFFWQTACAVLFCAALASAQTTSTTSSTSTTTLPTFPSVIQGRDAGSGHLHIMSGQSCAGGTCEAPAVSVMASAGATLLVDCTGTCQVKLQCRPPGFAHDVLLADSTSLSTASKLVALSGPCPWVIPQITSCGSGTCKVSAWILETGGNW